MTSAFGALRDKARETGTAPLVAQYMDKPYLGFLGVTMNLPRDEDTYEAFFNQLTDMMNLITGAGPEAAMSP